MMTATIPTRPEAALWDMDGTIIDSEPLWIEAELEMLDRFGLAFPEGMETELVGLGLTAAAERFQQLGVPLATDEIIGAWAHSVVAALDAGTPRWQPGALELLAGFRRNGVPNVLVTMSVRSIADAVVARLPEGTFAAVIAGDEVAHEKPHPDPYIRGAAAAGTTAERCIAFEDSRPGAASAVAAGAVVVGVPGLVPLAAGAAHELPETLTDIDVDAACALWARHRGTAPGDLAAPTDPIEEND